MRGIRQRGHGRRAGGDMRVLPVPTRFCDDRPVLNADDGVVIRVDISIQCQRMHAQANPCIAPCFAHQPRQWHGHHHLEGLTTCVRRRRGAPPEPVIAIRMARASHRFKSGVDFCVFARPKMRDFGRLICRRAIDAGVSQAGFAAHAQKVNIFFAVLVFKIPIWHAPKCAPKRDAIARVQRAIGAILDEQGDFHTV